MDSALDYFQKIIDKNYKTCEEKKDHKKLSDGDVLGSYPFPDGVKQIIVRESKPFIIENEIGDVEFVPKMKEKHRVNFMLFMAGVLACLESKREVPLTREEVISQGGDKLVLKDLVKMGLASSYYLPLADGSSSTCIVPTKNGWALYNMICDVVVSSAKI